MRLPLNLNPIFEEAEPTYTTGLDNATSICDMRDITLTWEQPSSE